LPFSTDYNSHTLALQGSEIEIVFCLCLSQGWCDRLGRYGVPAFSWSDRNHSLYHHSFL